MLVIFIGLGYCCALVCAQGQPLVSEPQATRFRMVNSHTLLLDTYIFPAAMDPWWIPPELTQVLPFLDSNYSNFNGACLVC